MAKTVSPDQMDIFQMDQRSAINQSRVSKPLTKKEKEMNLAIAKFIGLTYIEHQRLYDAITSPQPYRGWCHPGKIGFPEDEVKFSTSMDWLIPVLDKIQKQCTYSVVLTSIVNSEDSKFINCAFVPGGMTKGDVYIDEKAKAKTFTEAVYQAVYYFIRNYIKQDGKYGDEEVNS